MVSMRSLAASAGCAVLLGLALSGLVRAHLSDLEATAATERRQGQSGREQAGAPAPSGAIATQCCAHPESSPAVARQGSSVDPRPSARSRGGSGKGRSAPPSRRAPSGGPAPDTFSQELGRGIAEVGERRYEIKRGALDLALANLASLSRSARVAPELRAGRPFGFRLVAVAADGPFAKLGLRDDDLLVSINGLDLATAEHVLDAYGKLKQASHLVLGLLRGGHRTTLEYAIR